MNNKFSLGALFNPLDWEKKEEYDLALKQAAFFEKDVRKNLTLNSVELHMAYPDFSPDAWLNFTTNAKVVSFKLRFISLLSDVKYFGIKNKIEDKLEALAMKDNITIEESKQITALTKLFESSKKEFNAKIEELMKKQENKHTFIFNNSVEKPNTIQIIEEDSYEYKKESLKSEGYIIELIDKDTDEHRGFISTKNNYPTSSFGLVKIFQFPNSELFYKELDKLKKKFITYILLHHKIFLPEVLLKGNYELYTKD